MLHFVCISRRKRNRERRGAYFTVFNIAVSPPLFSPSTNSELKLSSVPESVCAIRNGSDSTNPWSWFSIGATVKRSMFDAFPTVEEQLSTAMAINFLRIGVFPHEKCNYSTCRTVMLHFVCISRRKRNRERRGAYLTVFNIAVSPPLFSPSTNSELKLSSVPESVCAIRNGSDSTNPWSWFSIGATVKRSMFDAFPTDRLVPETRGLPPSLNRPPLP